jgi:hypothetical protein
MRRLNTGFALILALLAAQASVATSVLDQSYEPRPNTAGYLVNSAATYAEVFQAGLSGPAASVDVRVQNYFGGATAPLQLGLWSVTGSYPETLSSNLASALIPQSSVPSSSGFVSFDLSSSGASFAAGQKYAIVLSTTSGNSYLWEALTNVTYTNGSARQVSGSQVYYTPAGQDFDFGFRTYVAAVPEPAALTLAMVGALCFSGIQRRRR